MIQKSVKAIVILCFILTSCFRYSEDTKYALQLAGDNRPELEKVLDHYRRTAKSKQKFRAAEFLIANLPYHYAVHQPELDSFRNYIRTTVPSAHTLRDFEQKYGKMSDRHSIIPDIEVITSEFLIRNIDFSFKLWQEMPWCRQLSFDRFCERILPYRVGNEPLEEWKEMYFNRYIGILDTLKHTEDPLAAGRRLFNHLNDQVWIFEPSLPSTPHLGASTLLKMYGNCRDQTDMMIYCMRSVGIPCVIDMIVQNPDHSYRAHYWVSVVDKDDRQESFELQNLREPTRPNRVPRKLGKVYRRFFAPQGESLPLQSADTVMIPSTLDDAFIRDISSAYFPYNRITLHPIRQYKAGSILYLSVFNNSAWIPMAWNRVGKQSIRFHYVESGIVYQLSEYSNGYVIPVSLPFIVNENGTFSFIRADTATLQTVKLIRKYRYSPWLMQFMVRAAGGKFQAADDSTFSHPVTLHTIEQAADMNWVDILPDISRKFRYVRYLSGPDGYNNMAEIQFFSKNKLLTGSIIGTQEAFQDDPRRNFRKAFDGNPETFFDAAHPDSAWVGMDFGKPQLISRISYIFRNDDNNIRPGDMYELKYRDTDKWISLGCQVAEGYELIFDRVPSGALYILHNHSRGKEERPFTYENNKQVWW